MNANKYSLTLGNITFSAYRKMPIVEVVMRHGEDEPRVVGYLSPFRDYSFQVSMTATGDGDIGSSDVINPLSGTAKTLPEKESRRAFLKGMILTALVDYTNTSYGNRDSDGNGIAIFPLRDDTLLFDRYIALVMEWMGFGTAEELYQWCDTIDLIKEFREQQNQE